MKTKLFYRLLLTVLCGIFTTQVNAQEVGDTFTANNGIEYQITFITDRGASKVKAIDYSGTSTSVDIPLIVSDDGNSYNVTAIGDEAFKQTHNEGPLTSVTIGNAVTSIGNRAFQDNNFTSVDIPNSVISIGDYAFSYNNITSLTIGSGVTSIGERAFTSNDITSLTIPNSVTSIGRYAFVGNDLTEVISLSENPATITSNVFDDDSLLVTQLKT
ncbi:hypothetical protein APS56_13300 [Pseudalgibacter alginicilyticus]|uniref:Cell surface protein n=1 Tax=Pseudalgibacter alginicilyticus TaxID=1736674 RepID=A0A0N7HYS2_9FLAO|nr:leucine-rich repeat domain-containing protein [Pseudalgibacter alginicilyticus]ALJ06046.1 hypothetical protein APS56_13300 [Pseudalgibacter alginicilyticus]